MRARRPFVTCPAEGCRRTKRGGEGVVPAILQVRVAVFNCSARSAIRNCVHRYTSLRRLVGADVLVAALCLGERARRRDPEAPIRLPPTCEVRGDSGARPPHSARPLPSPADGAQGVLCKATCSDRGGCADGHGAGPIRTSGRGQPEGIRQGHIQGATRKEAL